jgi:hypothetical protein
LDAALTPTLKPKRECDFDHDLGGLGMSAGTLRKWLRQAEVDAGDAAGVPTETGLELRELRRRCKRTLS